MQHEISVNGPPSLCFILFPPISFFCREVASSATGDLEERCKDSQRVLDRESQPTTHMGASDPIVSQLMGLGTPSCKHCCTFYMQSYAVLRVF